MTRLVQVYVEQGVIREQDPDSWEPPTLDLMLEENRRVVNLEWWRVPQQRGRKTVDWQYTVTIAAYL